MQTRVWAVSYTHLDVYKRQGMRKHINLIPFNGAKNGFTAPDAMTIAQFRATLEANHASVTVRRRIGADVEGACGQLRLKARDKR